MRPLLAPFFTPRALATLEARLAAVVDGLLDRIEDAGTFDVIEAFAAAVPIQVIGDLLGIPDDERGPLRGWSTAILGALEPVIDADRQEAGNRAVTDFKAYLTDLISRHRRGALDEDLGEIMRAMVASFDAGSGMSHEELLHNCIFLLNAGHETTTNLIGNAVEALFRFPEQHQALRARPDGLDAAVEEFLRFESSNQLGNRRAAAETEIRGIAVPAGATLHLGIGAANRDPRVFAEPDRLDLTRRGARHLAFGLGIHVCAGQSLARMEGRVSLGRLVARFPKLAPAGEPVRGGRSRFRGFRALPATVR